MITLALLLASLGIADLVRARDSGSFWRPSIVGVALFAVGVAGTGLDWWWYPVGALAVTAWLAATRPFASPAPATARGATADRVAYWAIRALAVAALAAFVAAPAMRQPSGWLTDWFALLPYAALDGVAFTTFALAVGGVLFLFETANVIVRAALRATGSDDSSTPVAASDTAARVGARAPRARWWSRTAAPATVETALVPLKGGRFIGPLERLFLLTLALSGEFTAIAAVVAAKGIIRFPEISRDDSGGSKAEYFLVGSFASWGLVLVVAVVVRFTAVN